jgi:RNA polymerase sigma-70 factor (ECF subfamily)
MSSNTLQIEIDAKYSDLEVLEKILEGETGCFEILVRRYNSALYKVGRSYGFNHEQTQDLMQDTYVDIYLGLPGFQGRASFKTWIIRIMLNNCFKRKQKFSFSKEIPNDINDNAKPMYVDAFSDINRSVVNHELGHVVEAALEKIPVEYRIVFALREVNGLTVKETSEVLQLTDSNVKVRLNRAKAMLKKEIEKTYSPDEIFEFNRVFCDAMVDRVMEAIRRV